LAKGGGEVEVVVGGWVGEGVAAAGWLVIFIVVVFVVVVVGEVIVVVSVALVSSR
jgi:hypothetical protein